MTNNKIIWQDSYKFSHFLLYPKALECVTSYIEPRGPAGKKVLFFGLQVFLKDVLSQPLTHDDVDEAKSYAVPHGVPFNEIGWRRIVDEFGGFLPLEIQALPEGTVHNTGVPQVQITSTHPDFTWLPSYVETAIIRAVWYPSTVATISWNVKNVLKEYLAITAEDPASAINFMLHDFGFRAASSHESAGIGGAGHLVNFMGTDTFEALRVCRKFYGEHMAGFSIPATEHSIATIYGPKGEEAYLDSVLSLIENGSPLAAAVSDSYDLWNFVENVIGGTFKKRIQNLPGRLVVRPDSGDPTVVPVKVVKMLGDIFGYKTNKMGYKVLPDFIRVIQGDGVNIESIDTILDRLTGDDWSAENIVFGMGGKLIGAPQRDDFRYAQKVNSATLNGEVKDIYKNPVTDPGKASKAGRQAVIETNGKLYSIQEDRLKPDQENFLKPVWRNGELLIDHTFAEIRARAA